MQHAPNIKKRGKKHLAKHKKRKIKKNEEQNLKNRKMGKKDILGIKTKEIN